MPSSSSLITRARARLRPSPPPVADPVVVNLITDPSFRGPVSAIYVHVHNSCEQAEVPGLGISGVRVAGLNENSDTHIAPGGRNANGEFRYGLRPGATYTASVSVHLPEPLTGPLNSAALRIVPGCIADDAVKWTIAQSAPARNEAGDHRISVTFTVPANAKAAWIRLVSGMSEGHGVVYWHSYSLVEGEVAPDFFDGSTPLDDFFAYAWNGTPNASTSTRTVRTTFGADRDAVAERAEKLAAGKDPETAEALLRRLPGDRLAQARVRLASGDVDGGRKALRRLLKADDPAGEAAYTLGKLALTEGLWATAERHLRSAHGKRPESPEYGYALAFAYDKLKRREDSRKTTASVLRHDRGLPFDGPGVLEMDVKCYGARRELGVFIAENLEQIREQARWRLEHPVVTTFDQPIFVYWAQGFESAPPVVKACLEALRAHNPGSRVHELTDANISAYVDVPEDLVEALNGNRTHFSDLLRLLLLEKFGGVWIDGTCLVTESLRPRVDEALTRGSVFAFNYTGPYISSWLIAARPGSYAIHLWRAACFLWWEKRRELIDYFLMHHVFEMLYHLDETFRAEWDAGLRLNSKPPHELQTAMLQPFDPDRYAEILRGSFAHKLRYKYQPHELRSESYLARVLRGDLPAK